ncbi:MAG: thermonuclease family protein [Pseudomonadales bacterium]
MSAVCLLKKALYRIAISAFLLCAPLAWSDCIAEGEVELARLDRVIDGDTFELSDGRKVRLIGVNTPELQGGSGFPQAHARDAQQFASSFLGTGGLLWLQVGAESKDRHGRWLMHVFDHAGRASLSEALISRGLAFQAVHPPNLAYFECLRQAELAARLSGLGVWQAASFRTSSIAPQSSGFMLLTGQVLKVSRGGSSWWLELEGDLVLRIDLNNQPYFDWNTLQALVGQSIEARGWLVRRDVKPNSGYANWKMDVYHPASIRMRIN